MTAVVEWQKGRINMRYLNFGFPSREEENILITAPKMKYSSLEEFMKSAISFLAGKAEDEYDANLWLEYYKGYKLVDVEKCESRWELEGYDYSVNEDKKLIHVIIEPILHAFAAICRSLPTVVKLPDFYYILTTNRCRNLPHFAPFCHFDHFSWQNVSAESLRIIAANRGISRQIGAPERRNSD